jgi:hypothetical protein
MKHLHDSHLNITTDILNFANDFGGKEQQNANENYLRQAENHGLD